MPDPNESARRAAAWIDAWNSRDLDTILTLYADDAEMASPNIAPLGLSPTGTLHGKEALRRYWRAALDRLPGLRFEPLAVYAGADGIVVRYRNDRGHDVCEYLRYGADRRIVQGAAHHLADDH